MKPILLSVSMIAFISNNAIPAFGDSTDRRRISHNSRQLQLVLDTPLETENEELSYANDNDEEAKNTETLEKETISKEAEGDVAAGDAIEVEGDSTGELIEREDSSPPVGAPVKAKRHSPTSAPTEVDVDDWFDSSPAPSKSSVTETFAPTRAPTKQHAAKTSTPTLAPTNSSLVIETDPPTSAPSKSLLIETPRPSPAPTRATIVETPSPSGIPTKSPVKKKHATSRTERPTLGRDNSEPDDSDIWGNELDETFSKHATSSPTTTPPHATTNSNSKNHALEKEAEEFVEDPYVRIASLVFTVVCVTLLIIVAQQMVENPDGFCAKLCRWTVAFFQMLCYPFILCLCCGGRNKAHHTHTLVSTDGFDDYDHDLSLA